MTIARLFPYLVLGLLILRLPGVTGTVIESLFYCGVLYAWLVVRYQNLVALFGFGSIGPQKIVAGAQYLGFSPAADMVIINLFLLLCVVLSVGLIIRDNYISTRYRWRSRYITSLLIVLVIILAEMALRKGLT